MAYHIKNDTIRRTRKPKKIATEDVAGVDFFLNIVQAGIITVGDEGLGLGLEDF